MTWQAMLAVEIKRDFLDTYPANPMWWMQPKMDGVRILAHVKDNHVRLLNREGRVSTKVSPAQLSCLTELQGEWVLDGEYVAANNRYYVFDLLMVNGVDATSSPYDMRYTALEQLFKKIDFFNVELLQTVKTTQGKELLASEIERLGGEGVILRRFDMPYAQGKEADWLLKVKFTRDLDCIITGTNLDGKHNAELSLVDEHGKLVTVGRCSLNGKPAVSFGAVVTVRCLTVSDGKRLIQPRLMSVRDDKRPVDCGTSQL